MITVDEIQKQFDEWDALDSRSKAITAQNEDSHPADYDNATKEMQEIKKKKASLEKKIWDDIHILFDENKAKIPYSETNFQKDMSTNVRNAFEKIKEWLN